VTNQKIRSISLGPISQFCLLLCAVWFISLFNQTLRYHEIISAKAEELDKLKSANSYFQEEFETVNDKLKKINEYLISVTGSTHQVKSQEQEFQQPKNIKTEDLSTGDQHTLNKIKDANLMLADIRSVARNRIKTIEDAISITGLNLKRNSSDDSSKDFEKEISLNGKKGIADRQGGPLNSLDLFISQTSLDDELIERRLEKSQFTSDIDRLVMLENLASAMPLSKPMKNYYISSGFGSRTDPITGRHAPHRGLDFVGPEHERVLSPSGGKVILAGTFSDYGNAVVIDHGLGITTRYGHLAAVKVQEGQIVKKGEVIAIQGNTGRSTGSHLHYEVRYKNTPLNPKKFLEAGDSLFNDEKTVRHVNS
jgi:murein DD-endopeptidase MepM/ murein hydrolase activator NlpD